MHWSPNKIYTGVILRKIIRHPGARSVVFTEIKYKVHSYLVSLNSVLIPGWFSSLWARRRLSGLNSPGSGLVASIDEKGLVIDHISMNTQSV